MVLPGDPLATLDELTLRPFTSGYLHFTAIALGYDHLCTLERALMHGVKTTYHALQ